MCNVLQDLSLQNVKKPAPYKAVLSHAWIFYFPDTFNAFKVLNAIGV